MSNLTCTTPALAARRSCIVQRLTATCHHLVDAYLESGLTRTEHAELVSDLDSGDGLANFSLHLGVFAQRVNGPQQFTPLYIAVQAVRSLVEASQPYKSAACCDRALGWAEARIDRLIGEPMIVNYLAGAGRAGDGWGRSGGAI